MVLSSNTHGFGPKPPKGAGLVWSEPWLQLIRGDNARALQLLTWDWEEV